RGTLELGRREHHGRQSARQSAAGSRRSSRRAVGRRWLRARTMACPLALPSACPLALPSFPPNFVVRGIVIVRALATVRGGGCQTDDATEEPYCAGRLLSN